MNERPVGPCLSPGYSKTTGRFQCCHPSVSVAQTIGRTGTVPRATNHRDSSVFFLWVRFDELEMILLQSAAIPSGPSINGQRDPSNTGGRGLGRC